MVKKNGEELNVSFVAESERCDYGEDGAFYFTLTFDIIDGKLKYRGLMHPILK
jgi:hypothetical protein